MTRRAYVRKARSIASHTSVAMGVIELRFVERSLQGLGWTGFLRSIARKRRLLGRTVRAMRRAIRL